MHELRDAGAIVGIGETDVGRLPGRSHRSLALEACAKAITDAGMTNRDVDGLLTQKPMRHPSFIYASWLATALGLRARYVNDLEVGGATPASMVVHAVMAIGAGLASTVVCVYGDTSRSASHKGELGKLFLGREEFGAPFGMALPPVESALSASRHMHEYGTTSRQLGAIAVSSRANACLNDVAQMKKPITIEDHQNSPIVAEPYHLLDCCLVSDGAGAVVVTSAERAKDTPRRPVFIRGFGTFNSPRFLFNAESMTVSSAHEGGKCAFAMAGLGPEEIDVAEIYDCFTYIVVVQLEDYGFCKKGEGGPFVESGAIRLDGSLPVNTHGGLLSQGHVDGMLHITEAVKQLRGEAGPRQIADAEFCLVSGMGGAPNAGAMANTTLILRR